MSSTRLHALQSTATHQHRIDPARIFFRPASAPAPTQRGGDDSRGGDVLSNGVERHRQSRGGKARAKSGAARISLPVLPGARPNAGASSSMRLTRQTFDEAARRLAQSPPTLPIDSHRLSAGWSWKEHPVRLCAAPRRRTLSLTCSADHVGLWLPRKDVEAANSRRNRCSRGMRRERSH